jgi:hypothetical protein
MNTVTVVRAWNPEGDNLLFEASSAEITPAIIASVLNVEFKEPDVWGREIPMTQDQFRALLRLMGKTYEGPGEFTVAREQIPDLISSPTQK